MRVLNLDSIYPGWDGLEEGTKAWQKISRNLRKGKPASYREWDWHADTPGPKHTINPAQETVIICEGVGAIAGTCDVRIVVKAPDELRYRRAIDRDGETYRPHWERWAAQEEALFADILRHVYAGGPHLPHGVVALYPAVCCTRAYPPLIQRTLFVNKELETQLYSRTRLFMCPAAAKKFSAHATYADARIR